MESCKNKPRNKKNLKEKPEPTNAKQSSNNDREEAPKSTKHQADPLETEAKPQPQRAPRRPRNESSAPSNNSKPVPKQTQTNPSSREVAEVKPDNQEPAVDHSKLKRETEEIEKFNKKYTKRKITSNWHRYSVPEGTVDRVSDEENVPADFSDLLQVPVSRGGHLQLKDEQDWSSGSGSTLGSYFALDLKKLNQSLACIPLYDQIHIPKKMFTVEEIKEFDSTARENQKLFESNSDTSNNMRNQIVSVSHSHKVALEISQKITSILKDDPIVIDIGNQSEDSSIIDNSVKQNVNSLSIEPSIEKQNIAPISQEIYLPDNTHNEPVKFVTNKISEGVKETYEKSKTEEKSGILSENFENGLIVNNNKEVQLPVISTTNTPKISSRNINNPVDDDDLDFLLSLSTPADCTHMKSGATSKTSSIIKDVGSYALKNDSQITTVGQSTELDDWLDSVLED